MVPVSVLACLHVSSTVINERWVHTVTVDGEHRNSVLQLEASVNKFWKQL